MIDAMAYTASRLFCHINEFRTKGWSQLPLMLLLGQSVTLWSPAPLLIDRSRNHGAIDFSSQDLLSLVEDGHVRIVGREKWFKKEFRDSMEWKLGHWDDKFDSKILEILERDQHSREPQVSIAPVECGYKRVDAEIANKSEKFELAKTLVKAEHLPKGTLSRIRELGAKASLKDKARAALRDAFNHDQALDFCRADIPVEPYPYAASLPSLSGRKSLDLKTWDGSVNPEIFERTLDLVRDLAKKRSIMAIAKIRKTNDVEEVCKGIYDLFRAEISPRTRLRVQIEEGMQRVPKL
jgi:predicted RNA binding protein with dsRBD fold (UPF0201 family)